MPYKLPLVCPEHYARIVWRDIGHKALCPISLTHFQKITVSILVSGVTSIQGLSAISFTMHMFTHKLACGVQLYASVSLFFRCHFLSRLPQNEHAIPSTRPLCSSCARRRTCLRHDRSVWLSHIRDECGEAIKFSN